MSVSTTYRLQICGQHLILHPFRAVYWEEQNSLLIADLHLGKAAHFRRTGIAVPAAVGDANLDKLISLLLDYQPDRVLFLGDLFHSEYNNQWIAFCELLDQFSGIHFELVRGNHDVLDESFYERAGLEVHAEVLEIGPFLLTHHPLTELSKEELYNLAGHIHPAVSLRGGGRQRLRLPCFFFGKHQGLLPAFGEFTGLASQSVGPDDRVFAIAEDAILAIKE
ncbi:MAG: ligase-associated DNA damage response endonuclease PdeM [Saprospiraceae bacterium]|nr:ligase-associated DNA damage response endonuclease PdeM [Lewinella sp.]